MPQFKFVCHTITERDTPEGAVWDAVFHPKPEEAAPARLGGQFQLAGLRSKLFERGRTYLIDVNEAE